eukprot:c19946_g1_i1 orf=356-1849(-)
MAAGQPSAERIDDQEVYSLEFDGASKGNPGKAGAGAILKRPDGTVLCQITKGVGIATCNFAEYQALILGLQAALDRGIHHIRAQGDSKLVCCQVMGEWKVKSDNLSTSFVEAMELKERFQSFSIQHVYRESNSAADALANTAVLLPEDNSLSSLCNRSPNIQSTMKISNKSTSKKHKGAKAASATKKARNRLELSLSVMSKSTELSSVSQEEMKKFYRMDYHGASSGKHGNASVGALLFSPDGSLHYEIKQGLGVATRNVAHYQALVIGLRTALECNVSHINIQGDALLIFKQMTGETKVKDESLLALWKEANALLTRFTAFSITHVDKCNNSLACALAEVALHAPDSDSNVKDALKSIGTPDKHGCVAVQIQNSCTRNITVNEITKSIDSSSVARKSLFVAAHFPQVYTSSQRCLSPFYRHQENRVLKSKTPQPLPFSRAISMCIPLYVANTSIHRISLLLPSRRLRFIPHIFESSSMYIAGGGIHKFFLSTLSFR